MRLTDRDPLTKMVVGDFRMEWILEAVRLGLIGGGMNPIKALKLTDRYVRDGFIMDYVETAADVLWVSLYGPEDEPLTPDEEPEEEDTSGEPMAEVSPTPSPALSGLDSIVSVGPPAAQ